MRFAASETPAETLRGRAGNRRQLYGGAAARVNRARTHATYAQPFSRYAASSAARIRSLRWIGTPTGSSTR